MGRKIPGKKHRTVKDPEKQRHKRLEKLKNKINNPPADDDQQEVPKSLLHIMKLKEMAKNMPKKRKKRKAPHEFDMTKAISKDNALPGAERPEKTIPVVKRYPNEKINKYMWRVTDTCNKYLEERRIEEKYKLEVNRDEEGKIIDVSSMKKEKKSKKPHLSQKRKERERKRKEINSEPQKEFVKHEKIEFGDIAHQPPSIKLSKNLNINNHGRKPGKKDLLLDKILKPVSADSKVEKPKKISSIERQKLEKRRLMAVEAFRNLKKQGKFSK